MKILQRALLNHKKLYTAIRETGNIMTSPPLSFLNDKNLIKANTESSNLDEWCEIKDH